MFKDLSAASTRKYIEGHRESEYALIDVRQPNEYEESHIPGGLLFPLSDLERSLDSLPKDKELIVYCRSGNRSRVASTFIAQSGQFKKAIYNLDGGIMSWQGAVLKNFPKVQLFDLKGDKSELLKKSLDLEKGAVLFYGEAARLSSEDLIGSLFEKFVHDEKAHAQSIFNIWAGIHHDSETFDRLFASLPGQFVEGGEPLTDVVAGLENIEGGFCLNALELALDIEFKAYDLYLNLAAGADDESTKKIFTNLAQAEKSHMRRLVEALEKC